MRVEGLSEPLAVDVERPMLSWALRRGDGADRVQESYRIEVRSRAGLLWDSGEVESAVPRARYDGPALAAMTRHEWTLRVVADGEEFVACARFGTSIGADGWRGSHWIAAADRGPRSPAPLLRREFDLHGGVVAATLHLAAGGLANATVNGIRATDDVLSPAFTNFDATVQYVSYDVAALLRVGGNVLGIELGRGFYAMAHVNVWRWESAPWHDEPAVRAILIVEHDDGRVVRVSTDDAWTSHPGPTVRDDLYAGETFDARLALPGFDIAGFDDARWTPAVEVAGPRGRIAAQRHEPIREMASFAPAEVRRVGPGEFVLIFPRVLAGWVSITAHGPAGAEIVLRYGEKLGDDGLPDLTNNGEFAGGFQTDRFILAGTGDAESWTPRFSYKGFRCIHVSGWPQDEFAPGAAIARLVRTDVDEVSVFDCSQPLLVEIHRAVVATIQNNLHGLPTDTPMFEKNGWTGDMTVGAELFLRNLDSAAVLTKWARDLHDSRDAQGVPHLIAPAPGEWARGDVAPQWHAAYIVVPWLLSLYTGDDATIRELYDGMLGYVKLEYSRTVEGIAGTCLGDWASPRSDPLGGNPPEDLRVCATAYLFHMLTVVGSFAARLGRSGDAAVLAATADGIRLAFNRTFLSAEGDHYRGVGDDGYRQTHNVLALAFGLVPDAATAAKVAARLVADVRERGGALDTGILGTKHLLPVLSDHGNVDVALDLALRTDYPSWGHMVRSGDGTLWEHWSRDARSLDHYFLGTIDDWLMGYVAGVRLSPTAGYRQLTFAPAVTHRMAWAEGAVTTPHGRAGIRWSVEGDRLHVRCDVPPGCDAVLRVPADYAGELWVDGDPAPGSADIDVVLHPGRTIIVCGRSGA